MSLFVGNVSKNVSQREFESQFKNYGNCRVDLRKGFAFVQFENDRNAEEAKRQLQHKSFCGLRFNIEWSKNSGRFNQNAKLSRQNNYRRSRSRERSRRREERWTRRSPSNERRSSPEYSDHEDLEAFIPRCPRDAELIKILKEKYAQKQAILLQKKRQAEIDGEIISEHQRNNEDDKIMEEQQAAENNKNEEMQKQPLQQGQAGAENQ